MNKLRLLRLYFKQFDNIKYKIFTFKRFKSSNKTINKLYSFFMQFRNSQFAKFKNFIKSILDKKKIDIFEYSKCCRICLSHFKTLRKQIRKIGNQVCIFLKN